MSWARSLPPSSFHTIFYQLSTIPHFFSIPHAALCIQCNLNFIAPLKPLQCGTVHLSLAFLRASPDLNTPQPRKSKIRTLSAQIQAPNQQKKHSRLLLHHSATAATALPDRPRTHNSLQFLSILFSGTLIHDLLQQSTSIPICFHCTLKILRVI